MYQRILVPVDDSLVCRHALREAIRIAGDRGATLCLLHVCDGTPVPCCLGSKQVESIRKALRESSEQLLRETLDHVCSEGLTAETRLVELHTRGHRVAAVIANHAREWSADLVVIATHGRRGLEYLLMGSVAEGVMRLSTVPVLLLRAPTAETTQASALEEAARAGG